MISEIAHFDQFWVPNGLLGMAEALVFDFYGFLLSEQTLHHKRVSFWKYKKLTRCWLKPGRFLSFWSNACQIRPLDHCRSLRGEALISNFWDKILTFSFYLSFKMKVSPLKAIKPSSRFRDSKNYFWCKKNICKVYP